MEKWVEMQFSNVAIGGIYSNPVSYTVGFIKILFILN